MNHDYAHCMDYSPDCPKDCFRGKLIRDLRENNTITLIGVPIAWSHLEGTDECKREESQHDRRSFKRNGRGSSKDGYEH